MKEKRENTVFVLSIAITLVLVIWAVVMRRNFLIVSNTIYEFLTKDFAWLYMISALFFVFFIFYLAFSKYGNIKLGDDDSKPDYSTISWFGMLFGCGMGVGLVFYGIAEPLSHFINPPLNRGIEAGSVEAAEFAMKSSFIHWGIQPWAIYSIIGLSLAYFMFRRKKKALVSTILEPVLGNKIFGPVGKIIDTLAVFATLAGVVTSLGLGTLQINSGLNFLFGIPENIKVEIIIILIITLIIVWSSISAIDKGIKLISDTNLYMALLLMLICFLIGPKLTIVNNFTNTLGEYINSFVKDSLRINPYGDNNWIAQWRIYYWAWFIAWGPFVGVFIARISKGRTIREFILGVVLAPSFASIIWFSIFGSMGLKLGVDGIIPMEIIEEIALEPERGLFIVLNMYPYGKLLSVVSLILLCTFFITSANSGTLVLAMLTSNGNHNPSKRRKVLWGIFQTFTAAGLLMAGGLKPLQTLSIAAAFPFIAIMIMTCVSVKKALKEDYILNKSAS